MSLNHLRRFGAGGGLYSQHRYVAAARKRAPQRSKCQYVSDSSGCYGAGHGLGSDSTAPRRSTYQHVFRDSHYHDGASLELQLGLRFGSDSSAPRQRLYASLSSVDSVKPGRRKSIADLFLENASSPFLAWTISRHTITAFHRSSRRSSPSPRHLCRPLSFYRVTKPQPCSRSAIHAHNVAIKCC